MAEGFSQFYDWKRAMLARRQLQRPDGRNLYEYRLTAEEFADLEALLTGWLTKLVRFELSDISRLTGFPSLFVLYAAERWRRRFDGTHWSWEPILRDIGATPDEWNQLQRSECVRLGLQDWGLTPRATGGLRFLGSVAVQGGLPLKLLAEARGRIGHLLGAVFKLARGGGVTPVDLETWVSSLQETLPKSYRLEAIYRLLANVAWTVLRLKEEAQLGEAANPIDRLNRQIPNWRERFPLPIDDDYAQKLIEQLVRDAASVRPERQAVCFPLERQIEAIGQGRWTLHSSLTLPDAVPVAALAHLLGAPTDALPRAGELTLKAGDRHVATAIRRMAGHERYRIERAPWGYAGETASLEHLLHFSAPDGRTWSASAPRGEVLDRGLPWVFAGGETSNRFMRQGSGGIAATEALVAVPAGWSVQGEDGAAVSELGQLESLDRRIYGFRGTIRTHDSTGLVCRLRTGQAGATDESYEWRGERVWLDFKYPGMAFKGVPRLYRITQDGEAQRMEGNSSWSAIGGSTPANAQPLGPITIRYPAAGDVRQRASLVALPPNATLSMAFRNAKSGTVRLENWGAKTVRVCADDVQHEVSRKDTVLLLSMQVGSSTQTPERVEIEVLWGHTPTPVRLTVPFPARGVRAFDASGKELPTGSLIAAQRLSGLRLSVLGGQENMRMSLEIGAGQGGQVRTHQLRSVPGALNVEVRLQDYASDIQHLLSTNDGPDARARVVVRIGGSEHYRLDVARYAAKLERNGSSISLDSAGYQMLAREELTSLPVLALCLERPGDEAIALSCCCSEGVPTGAWAFSPDERDPGSWLVYPGADAQLPFRPTLWPIPGSIESVNSLASTMGMLDREERAAALDLVIGALATDFLDPCWQEVDRLAGHVGHLPLTTLDLWRRFARSPRGMAALAFRMGNLAAGFLERFPQELPFAWEAVPFSAWRQALDCLQRQCNSIDASAGPQIFKAQLDSRMNDLTAGDGALHFLLGIACASYSPECRQQAQALRFVGRTADQHLFNGDNSLLMRLRQLHADDQWPAGFNPILQQARTQAEVPRFLHPQPLGFPDGVINLPLILAAQAATNQTGSWFANPAYIHLLRTHRAFDPEWFDEAYNLTIARCVADGLMEA